MIEDKRVQALRRRIRASDEQTIDDMLALVVIPAPPFGEAARAEFVAQRLRCYGYDVHCDELGNVLAHADHAGNEPPVVLAAHLDTIFPPETEIRVQRSGDRINAPGIADNARGLAALLAIARALKEEGSITKQPIVFAATVGEEGLGDLRGVKHMFRPGSALRRAVGFITLDGTGRRRIVYRAVGSRRLRVTMSGPGGHSWADWGVANPIHALARGIALLDQQELPRQPRTSLTVGRLGGGTSVNAIPAEAWLEADLRSEAGSTLAELETALRSALKSALDAANAARKRGTAPLKLDIHVIGDRPTGETSMHTPLVRAARAATRSFGDAPELVASSTDANIPIALGIPAIALGAGGESGGTHTTEEWYSNEGGPEGIERALIILLEVAGLA